MNYNSIKNFFSPIKLNPNRSEFNVFTSSERKRNSNENNIDLFHTNTIKRGKESENYDSIKKIKNVNQRIDDVISFLNQKQEHIENFQNKTFSSNEKFNWNKYIMDSKKKTEYEKIKENEILKERNAYLKRTIKEMKLKNEQGNNDTNSTENSYNYYFLLTKNKQLINENKNLKEEYNILKLEQKSSTNIDKIMDNKFEVISKMKSLKFSINNLLNLLSSTNTTEPNKNHNNIYNMPNYNNHSLKTHTINKYDINYRLNDFDPDINYDENNANTKDDNKKNDSNIIFTEGGNLNLNNNNSLLNENDTENNDENENFNDDSSDNEHFEISLKQFEKIDNKNLNNLMINNAFNKKSNTANVTKRQQLNKKMANLTEKRKNINNANSYTKEVINKKEMKKDFKKYFNDEKIMKNNGDNMSYNFLNFRNICLDKKMLFGNGKNISDLNNNIAQNFKINNTNIKSNKIKYDIFRTKNISQKTYKGNSHSKNFRKVNKSSKKIFK